MPSKDRNRIVQHVRRTMLRDRAAMNDRQLLEAFVQQADETALATLIRRHSPLVWGVCRRLLHRHHDAEDAFQATFLVLVRKAATLRDRDKSANWLYGVARQTAIRARREAARRGMREHQVSEMPESAAREADLGQGLAQVLDQEVSRLPAAYRAVVIHCDLLGQTRQEAARQLGCPEGTVAGHLARARAMLARRLTRYGLGVTSGAVALSLSQQTAAASVPAAVLATTIEATKRMATGAATGAVVSLRVAALTEGVLQTMSWNNVTRKVVVVLVLFLLGMGLVLA
jgi:RNA polymerase sigma factor (sigma-70 family)